MKKLKYFTKDGKEVKIGDLIEIPIKVGTKEIKSKAPLLPIIIDDLIEGGVITTKEETPTVPSISIHDIVLKTAKKLSNNKPENASVAEAIAFMADLKQVSIPTYIEFVLKQASIILNHKYPTRFKDCKEFWMFDMRKGEVFKVEPFYVNANVLRTRAVFHTKEEAVAATGLVEGELKSIYGK